MTVKKAKTTKKKVVKDTWKLTTIPLHSWITFWVLVLATMALATVCFSSAFKNSEGEVDQKTVAAFEAMRQNLEQQVAELQGKAEVSSEPAGRVLLSLGDKVACDTKLATSTADITVPALSDLNVRVNLPYSFTWGNEKYAINPWDHGRGSAGEMYFGPGIVSGDCLVVRDSMLLINNDTRSINEIRRELNSQDVKPNALRERTINGIPVLSYTIDRGAGLEANWIAFGRSNRYQLHTEGWLTDAEAVKIIQSLRVEN